MAKHVWDNVSGRFRLVGETDEKKIVGLLGTVWYHDFSDNEKEHIARFYGLSGHTVSYLENWPLVPSWCGYNNFLAISKTN